MKLDHLEEGYLFSGSWFLSKSTLISTLLKNGNFITVFFFFKNLLLKFLYFMWHFAHVFVIVASWQPIECDDLWKTFHWSFELCKFIFLRGKIMHLIDSRVRFTIWHPPDHPFSMKLEKNFLGFVNRVFNPCNMFINVQNAYFDSLLDNNPQIRKGVSFLSKPHFLLLCFFYPTLHYDDNLVP